MESVLQSIDVARKMGRAMTGTVAIDEVVEPEAEPFPSW